MGKTNLLPLWLSLVGGAVASYVLVTAFMADPHAIAHISGVVLVSGFWATVACLLFLRFVRRHR